MGLPEINVVFQQLASSAVARSTRGICAILIQDDTASTWTNKTYTLVTELNSEEFTAENYAAIRLAFNAGPYKVVVVRVGTTQDLAAATTILSGISYNWVCTPVAEWQSDLATYIVGLNKISSVKKYICLVSGTSGNDSMYVVNVANTQCYINSVLSNITQALPYIMATLAATSIYESATGKTLGALTSVVEVDDPDQAVDDGNLVLVMEESDVVIGRAVNTVTTTGTTDVNGTLITDDMKYITVVESMNMIREDIATTFKSYYRGKFKNKLDNQMLFVAAVNAYFKDLAKEDVLDNEFSNVATIDVETQRSAWIAAGKTEAEDWDDSTVRKMTYRTYLFMTADIRILNALEDMQIIITME